MTDKTDRESLADARDALALVEEVFRRLAFRAQSDNPDLIAVMAHRYVTTIFDIRSTIGSYLTQKARGDE